MEKVKNYLMTLCSNDRPNFMMTLLRMTIELVYLLLLLLAFFTVRGGTEPNFFNIFDFNRVGRIYFLISIAYIFVYPALFVFHKLTVVKTLAIVRFAFHVILILFILLTYSGVKDLISGSLRLSYSLSFYLLLVYIAVFFFAAFKPDVLAAYLNRLIPADFLAPKAADPKQEAVVEVDPVVEVEPIAKPEPIIETEPVVEVEPIIEVDSEEKKVE